MLKLKYLYENYDLAKSALENWEYDTDTLDEHLQNFRISSNAVYPFYVREICSFFVFLLHQRKRKII